MEKKIYVGNLPFQATEEDIKKLFSEHGEVESVKIITDLNTGVPRGFGFVEMPNKDEAEKAMSMLNGKDLKGRTLKVNEAKARTDRPRGGGGFGGGGGSRRY